MDGKTKSISYFDEPVLSTWFGVDIVGQWRLSIPLNTISFLDGRFSLTPSNR